MWEPTPGLTFICFGSTLFVLLLVGYAWVALYKLWSSHLRPNPISNFYQLLKLLGWLLISAFIILAGIYILAFFLGLFIVYVSALSG
jgi:hypothetical protein